MNPDDLSWITLLPPFGDVTSCPKCGHADPDDFASEFCAFPTEQESSPAIWVNVSQMGEPPAEHLHRTCVCGWSWRERCRDASEVNA